MFKIIYICVYLFWVVFVFLGAIINNNSEKYFKNDAQKLVLNCIVYCVLVVLLDYTVYCVPVVL